VPAGNTATSAISSCLDERVPASFDPIIGELRAAGRHVDADALAARRAMILDAG